MPPMTNFNERVAIVSQAVRLPGAGADLERFWASISSAADCSREVPDGRWPRNVYTTLQDVVHIASIACTLKLADVYDKVEFE